MNVAPPDDEEEVCYKPVEVGASKTILYTSVFVANLGAAAVGFVLGWSSPMLPLLYSESSVFPITQRQGAWITSFVPLGMFLGPVMAGKMLNTIGRRITILCYMLLLLATWGLMATLWSVWVLCVARFLQGVALGLVMSCSPVYISEIAEDSVRGILNTIQGLLMITTIVLAYAVGPCISYHHYIYMSCSPLLLFLLMFSYLQESPYFLVAKNRDEEAIKVLAHIRQLPELSAQKELEIIKVVLTRIKRGTFQELLSDRANLRALITTGLTMVGQQLSGNSSLFYYAQSIFSIAGVPVPSHICALIMALFMFMAAVITPLAVHLYGIKRTLTVSAFGSCITMGLLGYFIKLAQKASESTLSQWMVLSFLATFTVVNFSGMSSLPWAMIGELFPAHERALGSVVVTLVHALAAFCVVNIFPSMVAQIGLAHTCWLFSGATLATAISMAIYVPDTTGLSHLEIHHIMSSQKQNTVNK